VNRLAFMTAGDPTRRSPLAGLDLAGVVSDLSLLTKLEVRGDIAGLRPAAGEEVIAITDRRALVVTEAPPAEPCRRLAGEGRRVYDMTAALAAVEFEGDALFRRTTDLDPDRLPAAGAILRGTPAIVERREPGGHFRLYIPRELARNAVEAIVDLAGGIAS
jgi:hypothetical protein